MPHLPPMAWVAIGLGVVYLIVRGWMARKQEERQIARDERMAQLYAERDAILARKQEAADDDAKGSIADDLPPSNVIRAEAQPESLAAMVSDSQPPKSETVKAEVVKVRCRSCRALNDEDATKCAACGAEL